MFVDPGPVAKPEARERLAGQGDGERGDGAGTATICSLHWDSFHRQRAQWSASPLLCGALGLSEEGTLPAGELFIWHLTKGIRAPFRDV